MRALLTSARRVLIALVLIALVGGGLFYAIREGSRSRQDRAYARLLGAAQARSVARIQEDSNTPIVGPSSYLCEHRAGMPPAEIMIHTIADSSDESIEWSRVNADVLATIDAPQRWREFNRLAVIRHTEEVSLARVVEAANRRAIVVAAAAHPWTDRAINEALADDPEFRLRNQEAERALGGVEQLTKLMRQALPQGYVHAKVITGEMESYFNTGVYDFAAGFERSSMPRDQKPLRVYNQPATSDAVAVGDPQSVPRPPQQMSSRAAFAVCAAGTYNPERTHDRGKMPIDPGADVPMNSSVAATDPLAASTGSGG